MTPVKPTFNIKEYGRHEKQDFQNNSQVRDVGCNQKLSQEMYELLQENRSGVYTLGKDKLE